MNVAAYFEKIKEVISPWSRNSGLNYMKRISSLAEFKELVAIERCRANRNGGIFTLIVFKLEEVHLDANPLSKLTEAIVRRARITDRMGWYDHGLIGLILPETSGDGARKFLQDLYRQNPNGMPKPKVDLYVYPVDNRPASSFDPDPLMIPDNSDYCDLLND